MTDEEKANAHSETAEYARNIVNRIFGEYRFFSAIEWCEENRHDGKVTIVLSLTEIK